MVENTLFGANRLTGKSIFQLLDSLLQFYICS